MPISFKNSFSDVRKVCVWVWKISTNGALQKMCRKCAEMCHDHEMANREHLILWRPLSSTNRKPTINSIKLIIMATTAIKTLVVKVQLLRLTKWSLHNILVMDWILTQNWRSKSFLQTQKSRYYCRWFGRTFWMPLPLARMGYSSRNNYTGR
jgi:hypothetical protein